VNTTTIAALITAVGAIIVAFLQLLDHHIGRVEHKIDGLRNGTYHQAMAAIAELRREREEVRLRGLTPRRRVDKLLEEDPKT
jgi:hypothetical protein